MGPDSTQSNVFVSVGAERDTERRRGNRRRLREYQRQVEALGLTGLAAQRVDFPRTRHGVRDLDVGQGCGLVKLAVLPPDQRWD